MARIISAAVCDIKIESYTDSIVKCKLVNVGIGIEIMGLATVKPAAT